MSVPIEADVVRGRYCCPYPRCGFVVSAMLRLYARTDDWCDDRLMIYMRDHEACCHPLPTPDPELAAF